MLNSGLGFGLLILIIAMAVCMALIPLLIRYAPAMGMMDPPDPRKVHAIPVPRVGGIGIVLGALIPLAIWLPWDEITISYLLGSLTLLVFGVWDDIKELGHYVKFVGQFIAVILLVYYGDLYVTHFPFMSFELLDESIGKPFTVIAIIGMINAINHSDGLDGLAGGESLLSLGAIAYLAYHANDTFSVFIAVAVIGGVFGFLRFNSHPARVFMGDGGSQFLGFTLGFLAVYLTQVSNPALSSALPVLLLGLPIADILAVAAQRIYGGMNWFKATKNHIHHRLLELGFHHYESVVVIYSIQAFFVVGAVILSYESDWLLLSIYLVVCAAIFTSLTIAEHRGYQFNTDKNSSEVGLIISGLEANGVLTVVDRLFIQFILSVFIVVIALSVSAVPVDIAIAATGIFTVLLLRLMLGYRAWFLYLRLLLFIGVAIVVYLSEFYPPEFLQQHSSPQYFFYGLMVVAVALAVRFSDKEFFEVSPLDYLVLLIVVVLGLMAEAGYVETSTIQLAAKLIVLFYGVEIVIRHMRNRWNLLTVSVLLSLGLVAARGLG